MDTKSAWASSINWTQAISVVLAVATLFGVNVPDETKAQLLTGIASIAGVVTWFLRTFHTKTAIKAK